MLAPCLLRRAILTVPLVFVLALLVTEPVRADQEAGTAIPAESKYHPAVLSYSPLQFSYSRTLRFAQIVQTILDMSCRYCFKTAR